MEQTRSLPAGALTADDLADVHRFSGPCLTVRMHLQPNQTGAAHRAEVQWGTLAKQAAEAGAPDAAIDAVGAVVEELATSTPGVVVAADAAGSLVAEPTEPSWPSDELRWQDLPWFTPFVCARQSVISHAIVICDRSGADVTVVSTGGRTEEHEVGGRTFPIHKASGGGWSESRIQRRPEQVWRANAGDVADRIVELVRARDVEVVLLGGEQRALALVHDALPVDVEPALRLIDASRAAGSDDEAEEASIRRTLADVDARRTVEWLHTLAALQPQGEAVRGLDEVNGALQQGQVATLLTGDGGPELDAAIVAALTSGAGVRSMPPHALSAVAAAVLRWPWAESR